MTEEEMKEFFEWADLPLAMIRNNEIEGGVTLEAIYQAFKTRLLSETDLRIWPTLDCQGVKDDKGKISIDTSNSDSNIK